MSKTLLSLNLKVPGDRALLGINLGEVFINKIQYTVSYKIYIIGPTQFFCHVATFLNKSSNLWGQNPYNFRKMNHFIFL
jgi:uncharacterized membrane protein YhfC